MKNLKTELAKVIANNFRDFQFKYAEVSANVSRIAIKTPEEIAQAIIDSGLMVDRESVAELVEALTYAIRFARPEVMDRDYLKEALSKFQSKGETDAK